MSSTDPVPGLPGFKFTELEPFERQVKTQLHKFELQQHGGGALKVSTVLSYLDAIIPSDSAWRNWHDDQVATLEADAAKWCKDAHDAKHQGQQSPPACPPLCGKKLFDYYLHLLNQHFKRERSKYYSIKFESASMGGNDPRSYLSELRKCEGHVTDLSKRRVVKKFFEGLPDRLRERVLSTVPTHEDLGDLYGQLPALADTAHALWSLMLDMGYSLAHSDQAKPKQEKPASSSATPQGKGGNHSSNSPYGNPYRIGSQRRTAAATTAAARTTSQGEQGSAIDEEALYQRLRADFESRFAAASTSSGGAGQRKQSHVAARHALPAVPVEWMAERFYSSGRHNAQSPDLCAAAGFPAAQVPASTTCQSRNSIFHCHIVTHSDEGCAKVVKWYCPDDPEVPSPVPLATCPAAYTYSCMPDH
ncbi:hypothetical protein HXX76_016091 [Chlamydomonas incerta]|uniref:Uncharacterized protein n=1 Tax=Chlamydomonas incerta TaxID=51695 RepID=A0A835VR22_CHLIN|nr:hypothetical protein HXX76_016091 [Chlamydomonas incerta]|eukprot:KAG2422366.1 hypothetical protein HXX76_016091 [Chlamydomonas incerta]